MKHVIAILSAIVVLLSAMSILVYAHAVEYPIYTLTYSTVSPDETLVYDITTVTMQSSASSSPQTGNVQEVLQKRMIPKKAVMA